MKINKQKWNWMTDAVLLVGFLAAFFLDLAGLPLHQWLGVALGLLTGYHFLLHRDWVKSVTQKFWLSGICRDTPSYLAAACRTNW